MSLLKTKNETALQKTLWLRLFSEDSSQRSMVDNPARHTDITSQQCYDVKSSEGSF